MPGGNTGVPCLSLHVCVSLGVIMYKMVWWGQAKFGVGYNLVMTRSSTECNDATVSSLVAKHVPQAVLLSSAGGEIAFQLPLSNKGAFTHLFQELEDKKNELHIGGYGVSMTTLEEVFLRLAGDGAVADDMVAPPQAATGATKNFGQIENGSPQGGTNGLHEDGIINGSANGGHNSAHDVVIPISYKRTRRTSQSSFARAFGQIFKKRFVIAKRDLKVTLFSPKNLRYITVVLDKECVYMGNVMNFTNLQQVLK